MNSEAKFAFNRMFENAKEELGEIPTDGRFIFCACENGDFDYSKPQNSVRTAWRSLTKAAGLKGFRMHDLRHTAITDLAEAGTPDSVIESMAGHLSHKMREHYTHVRTKAKEIAVAALGTGVLEETIPVRKRERVPQRELGKNLDHLHKALHKAPKVVQ